MLFKQSTRDLPKRSSFQTRMQSNFLALASGIKAVEPWSAVLRDLTSNRAIEYALGGIQMRIRVVSKKGEARVRARH